MSLLRRLLILVVLILSPALAIIVQDRMEQSSAYQRDVLDQTMRLLDQTESEQARTVDNLRMALMSTAKEHPPGDGRADCRTMLDGLELAHKKYVEIYMTTAGGELRCRAGAAFEVQDGVRDLVAQARATDNVVVGGPVLGGAGHRVLPFAMRYPDEPVPAVGVTLVLLDLEWLEGRLLQQPLPRGSAITLFDRTGGVLVHFPAGTATPRERLSNAWLSILSARARGTAEIADRVGHPHLVAYSPPGFGPLGEVLTVVSQDMTQATHWADASFMRSVGLILALLLCGLGLAWWGGERYLRRPIDELILVTRRWRDGDLSSRAGLHDGREMMTLGRAFNEMADELQAKAASDERVRTLERRMAAVLGSMTDMVYEVDANWRITFMNDRARRELAGGRDLTGQDMREVFPGFAGTRFESEKVRTLRDRVTVEVEDYYEPHGRWYRCRAFPTDNGVAAYLQDVTEAHEDRRHAQESSALVATVLESCGDPVFVKDLGGRYTLVNAATERLMALPRTAIIGRLDRELPFAYDLERITACDRRVMQGGHLVMTEEELEDRSTGRIRVSLVTKAPWRDAGGRIIGLVGVARDITDRKRAELASHQAADEAQRANIGKSRFLAAASHDLRQPLQSAILFAGVLASHTVDETAAKTLVRLERSLGTLKELLDALLDVSRLDAGVVTPVIEEFPIEAVLEEILVGYEPVAQDKNLKLMAELCRGSVRSDRTLLGRMVRNLMENAIRYTERGWVMLSCHRKADRLRIEVADTGIGIAPDQLSQIWEEFHQVGNPERDRDKGLGLGLAIVQRLSLMLGHPVEVKSEPGKGSTFSIEVPAALGERQPVADAVEATVRPEGGRLAVIIEDDDMVRVALELMLTDWGYEVLAAPSSAAALKQLDAGGRRPDVVLVDFRLPEDRNGAAAILRIREIHGNVPGVILTGETGPEPLREAAEHGFWVVRKPVTPHQLATALEREMGLAADPKLSRLPRRKH